MQIHTDRLERMMQIAKDIRKEFHYSKCEGSWQWCDRGEDVATSGVGPFSNYFEALQDAVTPYLDGEEVEFTVRMRAKLDLDTYDCRDDAIADVDIPENDQCTYIPNSFEVVE
jgi:hypothetical protein